MTHPIAVLVILIVIGLAATTVQPWLARHTRAGHWLADHEPGAFTVFFFLVGIAVIIAIIWTEIEAAR